MAKQKGIQNLLLRKGNQAGRSNIKTGWPKYTRLEIKYKITQAKYLESFESESHRRLDSNQLLLDGNLQKRIPKGSTRPWFDH